MLFVNDFYSGKKTNWHVTTEGPPEIIDINDTNTKIKFSNKFKVLNIEKIKLFLEEDTHHSENDTHVKKFNSNDIQFYYPMKRTPAKLINHKNAVQSL